jgi:hypothetical protein
MRTARSVLTAELHAEGIVEFHSTCIESPMAGRLASPCLLPRPRHGARCSAAHSRRAGVPPSRGVHTCCMQTKQGIVRAGRQVRDGGNCGLRDAGFACAKVQARRLVRRFRAQCTCLLPSALVLLLTKPSTLKRQSSCRETETETCVCVCIYTYMCVCLCMCKRESVMYAHTHRRSLGRVRQESLLIVHDLGVQARRKYYSVINERERERDRETERQRESKRGHYLCSVRVL